MDIKVDINKLLEESKFIKGGDVLLAEGMENLRYATPKVIKLAFDYVCKNVPKQNIKIPEPRILKEVLENIAFTTDEELREMYLNLLVSSCDTTKHHLAHPAYAIILTQINLDEVELIKKYYEGYLRKKSVPFSQGGIGVLESEYAMMEKSALLSSYKEHLISLAILNKNTKTNKSSLSIDIDIDISEFGLLFAQSCIPRIGSCSSSES